MSYVYGIRGTRTPCPRGHHELSRPGRRAGPVQSPRAERPAWGALRLLARVRARTLAGLHKEEKVHQGVAPCPSGLQSDVLLSDSWTQTRRGTRTAEDSHPNPALTGTFALAMRPRPSPGLLSNVNSPPGICTRNPPVNNRTL